MKYKVVWNRGDDEGKSYFEKLNIAKKYAKSVHGVVFKFKTKKVMQLIEFWEKIDA